MASLTTPAPTGSLKCERRPSTPNVSMSRRSCRRVSPVTAAACSPDPRRTVRAKTRMALWSLSVQLLIASSLFVLVFLPAQSGATGANLSVAASSGPYSALGWPADAETSGEISSSAASDEAALVDDVSGPGSEFVSDTGGSISSSGEEDSGVILRRGRQIPRTDRRKVPFESNHRVDGTSWKPEGSEVTYDFSTDEGREVRVTSCPPPTGRCSSAVCSKDQDCSPGRLCCFNGCVRTCVVGVDPPPVVDWEEETPDSRTSWQELQVHESGCQLSARQRSDLEDFRNGGHVHRCYCTDEGVVCEVNARRRR